VMVRFIVMMIVIVRMVVSVRHRRYSSAYGFISRPHPSQLGFAPQTPRCDTFPR
jgi:hypothetical protein